MASSSDTNFRLDPSMTNVEKSFSVSFEAAIEIAELRSNFRGRGTGAKELERRRLQMVVLGTLFEWKLDYFSNYIVRYLEYFYYNTHCKAFSTTSNYLPQSVMLQMIETFFLPCRQRLLAELGFACPKCHQGYASLCSPLANDLLQ